MHSGKPHRFLEACNQRPAVNTVEAWHYRHYCTSGNENKRLIAVNKSRRTSSQKVDMTTRKTRIRIQHRSAFYHGLCTGTTQPQGCGVGKVQERSHDSTEYRQFRRPSRPHAPLRHCSSPPLRPLNTMVRVPARKKNGVKWSRGDIT